MFAPPAGSWPHPPTSTSKGEPVPEPTTWPTGQVDKLHLYAEQLRTLHATHPDTYQVWFATGAEVSA